jgi:hypothetical protein
MNTGSDSNSRRSNRGSSGRGRTSYSWAIATSVSPRSTAGRDSSGSISVRFGDPRNGLAYGYSRRRFSFPVAAAPETDRLTRAVYAASSALR